MASRASRLATSHGLGRGAFVAGLLSLYTGEAELVGVEGQGERAGGDVVHGPRGADEVRDAVVEEPLGEARGQIDGAQPGAVRRDAGLAGVGEDEARDTVDPAQLVGGEALASGEDPTRILWMLLIINAVTGEVEHVVGVEHQVPEDRGAGSLVRPEESHDLDPVVAQLLLYSVKPLEKVGDPLLLCPGQVGVLSRVRNHEN